jgi:benzoate/toluate 1,2-dioxygenase reductase subunit
VASAYIMSRHNVTLLFEDGRAVRIEAEEGDTIYSSSLRRQIQLLTDCREGACATCRALCTVGSYWMGDYSIDALSKEEAARRYVLTCQMHPSSDCIIELPYASKIALEGSAPEKGIGTVQAVEFASSCVVRLIISVDENYHINFLPGQYAYLDVPGTGESRAFSFANSPGSNTFEFFIRILPSGVMSDYLRERASAGDKIRIAGPFGKLYMRPLQGPILMVAGGTGLAPFLSMLEALATHGADLPPLYLLYGANQSDELFALDRLGALAQRGLPLKYATPVLQPGVDWSGPIGHVTALIRPALASGEYKDAYLCGPPIMVEKATSLLVKEGLPNQRIYSERFIASTNSRSTKP